MTDIKNSQQQLYAAINNFVEPRQISLHQFWYTDRICIPTQTFIEMVEQIGIKINSQLVQKLQRDEVDLISLQMLILGVQYWKQIQINIATYFSKYSPIKRQKIKQESLFNSQLSHSNTNTDSKSNMSANKKFLSEHAKKKIEDEIKLNITLRNVKNESDYGLSMNIGELNDICLRLKNNKSFWIERKKDGKIEILAKEQGGEKIISQKQFETKYEKLKQKFMNMAEEETSENLQQDLKKVLVEVMCLSSEMKKQIRLLERKGIQH